jgi:hypothetical protein
MLTESVERWWSDNDSGKTEIFGEKPVPTPLDPPQIPHRFTWRIKCFSSICLDNLLILHCSFPGYKTIFR